ncbi:7938_t:CDS:2 [Dentiscutata erythropus]|uniref:7938_t:CDS:1 n=1 Tax=Dentiscutata erythropus TaxID=1348616 RepID=A0A9N9CJH0_9GLOM|nr:7938_t:CDS:2 [Dentiscutata erythropus]
MSLYNNNSQRDFSDDNDTHFSDSEDENIQDNLEETITSILSLSNKDKSSILENLKNCLATTYKEKVEVNIQKTIEEGWEVARAKKLLDEYYEAIVNHFDEMSDVDHEMLITVFSKPPFSDFSYRHDTELIWCPLFNNEASEHCYHSEIINPLLVGIFEMIERSVWLEIGEIENEIQEMIPRKTISDQNLE